MSILNRCISSNESDNKFFKNKSVKYKFSSKGKQPTVRIAKIISISHARKSNNQAKGHESELYEALELLLVLSSKLQL